MKIKKLNIIIIVVTTMFLGACSEFLETNPDNRLTIEEVNSNPALAEGWILKAYKNLPTDYDFDEDVASDDAVTNDPTSNIITINTGGWTANNDPLGTWATAYSMNMYLNTFLTYADGIEYSWESKARNDLFRQKLKGEAHALRGYWNTLLLMKHAGVGTNGELLGFPIVNTLIDNNDDYQIPRNSFSDCVKYILDDLNFAIDSLPLRWKDSGTADYNAVMGARNENRINGLAAMLIKSRLLLFAASPAYNSQSGYTMQQAADAAAAVITANNGLTGLKNSDLTWYNDVLSSELIWNSTKTDNTHKWEDNCFPPTLFGDGRLNPSQNLVDAFPMADGKPISESVAYNPNSPYVNRDPRLSKYIVVNGATFAGGTIKTYTGSGNDAPGAVITSTRTSYYAKKFMNESVRINPAQTIIGAAHFYTYARYTEALLNFAEAANEAVGPTGSIGGITAQSVINAIRTRAGITNTTYVNDLDKEGLRNLIRSERRIELCFEGFRFYDIRRWNMTDVMVQPVNGVQISADQTAFTSIKVEDRQYQPYQVYGPIPYSETLKYDIIQNNGW